MSSSEQPKGGYQRLKSICKEEFIKFCENTTIRGVPRIVKSCHTHIRYLWLTFFILLMIGFIVCIIFLWFQYREYDVIHPPRILSDQKAPFPSWTVCNFRPMARNVSDIMKKLNIKDPREFAHSINKYAIKYYYRRRKVSEYGRASSAMNMGAYLESVPNRSFAELGQMDTDFIIYCQVTYMDGSNPQSNQCNNIGKWRRIVHAQYINCYSFNLHANYSHKTNTVELYLYLDQITPPTLCIDCFSSDVKSQLSGALILIHRRMIYPNFNDDVINLQPGTLTEIKLKIFENRHQTPPYGRCSRDAPKHIRIYDEEYEYSEYACKQLTIQHDINAHCGCNTLQYPIDNFSQPFCSHLPRFIHSTRCHDDMSDQKCMRQLDQVVKQLDCKANISKQYDRDILKNCPLSCKSYSYENDRSTSGWPTKTWQLKWLTTTPAKRIRMKKELQEYGQAYHLYLHNNISEAFRILNKLDILEQRLLAVMINRPNYNVHLVQEKEVLSLTSFMSQAGGLCSIWIGLTLISIVEGLEMIINCVSKVRSLKSPKCNKTTEKECPCPCDNNIYKNTYSSIDDYQMGMGPFKTSPSEMPRNPAVNYILYKTSNDY